MSKDNLQNNGQDTQKEELIDLLENNCYDYPDKLLSFIIVSIIIFGTFFLSYFCVVHIVGAFIISVLFCLPTSGIYVLIAMN
jgi:hypothetical protein